MIGDWVPPGVGTWFQVPSGQAPWTAKGGVGTVSPPCLVLPALLALPSPTQGVQSACLGQVPDFALWGLRSQSCCSVLVGGPFLHLPLSQGLCSHKAFLRDPIGGSASSYLPSLFLPLKADQPPPVSPPSCPCWLCHRVDQVLPLGLVAYFLGAVGSLEGEVLVRPCGSR